MDVLIKLSSKPYEDLTDFLKSLFYKNENLAEIALKILVKIYSSEFGIRSGRWMSNISEFFGVYPPDESDKVLLDEITRRYIGNAPSKRGVKQYTLLIEKLKKGTINLSNEEKDILEKTVLWNSSVSRYYTIIKKLKNSGIIEKKKGYLVKSSKIHKILDSIKNTLGEIDSKDRTYISK